MRCQFLREVGKVSSNLAGKRWASIGKEANQLDEVQKGVATPTEVTTVYDDGAREDFRDRILPMFAHLSARQLGALIACDHRTIDRIRRDGQMPRRALYEKFVALALGQSMSIREIRMSIGT